MTRLRPISVELDPEPADYPTALVTAKWGRTGLYPSGGVWGLTATCPFPGPKGRVHKHYHGGGDFPRAIHLGHRVADCGGGSYYITLDPAAPVIGPATEKK